MKAEFWHQRWEENQIGFHQDEINAHLQSFWGDLKLPAGSRVFVPLCGKSRDMLWLAGEGHKVLGVELSPIAVEDLFEENELKPVRREQGPFDVYRCEELEVLLGDFFDIGPEELHGVAGVYDRASLVALPQEMRRRYADHLKAVLPPTAELLLVTMDYPQSEMDGPPFSVTEEEVRALYEDAYTVTPLATLDILEENPRFRERGLTRMEERVYRLSPRR